MAVEVVKIKMAQCLEDGEQVEVCVLPFSRDPQLSKRLKTRFDDVKNVNVFDSAKDFIKKNYIRLVGDLSF